MIHKFIEYLTENKIDFIIINGYKDIVGNIEKTNDNDILFKKSFFNNIDDVLKNFCKESDYLIVQSMHHDIYAKNFFLYSVTEKEFLNLDLYGEISKEGFVFYNEDDVFNTIRYFQGLPILSYDKDFFTYLIKKIYKKDLDKKSFDLLKELYLCKNIDCKDILKKYIPKNSKFILESFENNEIDSLLKNRKNIINELFSKHKNSFTRELQNKLRILKRVFNPTGLTISFLGSDGSGKSTIIKTVQSSHLPFRRSDYFHLKPKARKKMSDSIEVDDPHKHKPYLSLKSYMKLFFFILQYNYGWLKNILKLKIKSSLVIFDRYYDDLLVDTKRYRYGGSLSIARFVRNFIPRPDLYFILTTDAEVIYKRKQEVPFEELERQIEEYRKLGDDKRYFNIDVNRTPEEISNEIIEIIARKMNERY